MKKENLAIKKNKDVKRSIGTKFSGKLSELMQHGALQSQRSLVDIHSCTSTLSLNILLFSDTVIIFHSPNGCLDEAFALAYIAAKTRGMEMKNPYLFDLRNIHCCSTGLNQNDVIFGGEKKLKKAIIEAKERYKPRMICVVAGCVSAIIGDNIDKICEEAQEEIGDGTYVLPFNNQGFQSHSWMHYSDNIWSLLVERVMKKQDYIDPELLNFYRPINMTTEDCNEIERIMNAIGFRINIFPDYQSIDTLETAPGAVLNIGLCRGYHQPVVEAMHRKFNTPYVETSYPLGIEFTKMWLREIGSKTNKRSEVEKLIADEIERITPELNRLRERLKDKTVVITANHAKTLAYVQVCSDLGMKVISIITHATDDSLNKEYDIIKEKIGDVDIHVGSPIYEEISWFNQLKPDIILGHLEVASVSAQLGFATKNSYFYNFQKAHVGFEGVITIGRQMIRSLKNPLREKILKYYSNESGLNWKDTPFYSSTQPFKFAKGCGMNNSQKRCGMKNFEEGI